jgi:hypothetical protein
MTDEDLNDILAAYRTTEPSAALRERVIAAAPRERSIGRFRRWAMGLALSAGFAASAAAGVACGFALTPASVTRLVAPPAAASAGDVSSLADPTDDPTDG